MQNVPFLLGFAYYYYHYYIIIIIIITTAWQVYVHYLGTISYIILYHSMLHCTLPLIAICQLTRYEISTYHFVYND